MELYHIPLIYIAAVLLVGAVCCFDGGIKKAAKLVLWFILPPFVLISLIVVGILFDLYGGEDMAFTRQQAEILLIAVPVYAFIAALVIKKLRKKRFVALAALILAVGTGMVCYDAYIDAVPTLEDRGYTRYADIVDMESELGPSDFVITDSYPRLDGATALYPVYAAFHKAVCRCDNYFEHLDCYTTAGSYENIIEGSADIIFVASASKAQAQAALEKGVELVFAPIGSEAFVFIVNAKNPLDDISSDDLRRIYTGEITDWSELGAGRGSIIAYSRREGSGSQTAFEKYIADENLIPARTETVVDTMIGMYERVADYKNFKNALGYSFRYYCTDMLGGNDIKLLSIDGVSPTPENIKNGTYPFCGNFYAVYRADAGDTVKDFVSWMQGPQGQWIVNRVGYVGLEG